MKPKDLLIFLPAILLFTLFTVIDRFDIWDYVFGTVICCGLGMAIIGAFIQTPPPPNYKQNKHD